MPAAHLPDNETERLAALRALLILDTPPEQRFDKIVQFAAEEFDMPIAMISLIDSERQWLKACVGTPRGEMARDITFCSYAILQPDILLIEDAQADPRFADNPLVRGDPYVRFYAGAPLVTPEGYALGTLCLVDTVPRTLDQIALTILSSLRDLLVLEMCGPAEAANG